MTVDVRPCLRSSSLGVMTFLNEIVQRFPDAVSFAPGRPSEQFFAIEEALGGIGRWVRHRAAATGRQPADVWSSLGQYGNTAGLIQDLLVKHLSTDLGIAVDESSILVTTGCQEAMLIAVLALLEPATDTLLVSDPAYVGITGIAAIAGVPIHPVPSSDAGLEADRVEEAIRGVLRSGRRPRALYDVPDFNNPLGTCMSLPARHELLRLAARHGMLVLEDNPYGAFSYDRPPLPTLKALDTSRSVLYLGSFSKTLFPGLRLGYIVADQDVAGATGGLAGMLASVKSFTTVNTSPITQAIAGGALLQHEGSLASIVSSRLPHYRANRDRLLAALSRNFADAADVAPVRWNHPAGGFFVVVTLPFEFGPEELERCAADFGVIVSPMAHFALTPGRDRQVRLSFSYVDGAAIDEGVRRFCHFVRDEAQRVRGGGSAVESDRASGDPLRPARDTRSGLQS